ncbi:DUF6160 family protein [Pseudomonas sp.]|uniref:DUF6160 family protein n=1 Tax=Pseudomonas sp. TaxID=306 RepID=UPI002C4E5EB1|nr:DUF6160 family protein [Pseudomonas sp.]HUE94458.1 DUF6160 family protein [Pseudomonas sp.]
MKTLKQLALAAAVLAVPFMAQADLQMMDDSALATVTGQDGISISGNFNGTIGSIVYTDGDVGGGSLRMETIAFTGFNIADDAPVMVDVVTNDIGGTATQQLQISMPTITGQLSVGAIKVGDTTAASIGSLAISDLNMAGTTVKVWGH